MGEEISTIDLYIAGFPKPVQKLLNQMRGAIAAAAPSAQEAIKYRIPTFVLNGNLVHFAAFARHIGFYPTPSAITQFSSELTSYQVAKGSIQFPIDQPLPLPLVRKMVLFRVSEAETKGRGPQRKKSVPSTPKATDNGAIRKSEKKQPAKRKAVKRRPSGRETNT